MVSDNAVMSVILGDRMKDSKRQAATDYYMKASKCASEYVEQEARKILVEHPELNEFVMAMGSWHFSWKVGATDDKGIVIEEYMNNVILDGEIEFIDDSDLAYFMAEWDSVLKITGEPMRFTAKGKMRRDW